MKKPNKIVRLGFSYYSETKITVNSSVSNFQTQKKEDIYKFAIGLAIIVSILSINGLSAYVLSASQLYYQPLQNDPPYSDPYYYPPTQNPGDKLAKRLIFFVAGLILSRTIGGQLLMPPTRSTENGYTIGLIWCWLYTTQFVQKFL
jgi:hypothetical protein